MALPIIQPSKFNGTEDLQKIVADPSLLFMTARIYLDWLTPVVKGDDEIDVNLPSLRNFYAGIVPLLRHLYAVSKQPDERALFRTRPPESAITAKELFTQLVDLSDDPGKTCYAVSGGYPYNAECLYNLQERYHTSRRSRLMVVPLTA
jgi:hypothetical protein